ncbi:cupin domain-containing protein [Brachybacterium sp. YJGR34]|uniref:(R)-mandelonitrile lyase n=1 Tax=Brachybacterium sp. YJGR34 TaxID=2059911 RepID=UPI000E0A45D4|nr:cupin domain-containing protein [Brachybacterium sp. YJGR34]
MEKLPRIDTTAGPDAAFTGDVQLEVVRPPRDGSRATMNHVHFRPGARTHWHWHPAGQTLVGSIGLGLVVTRAGEVLTLEPGRTIWIPPREEHWHGAVAGSPMSHLAMQEADGDGETVIWLEPVDEEEFARANAVAGTA